jgi:hypothetical protein
MNVDPLGRLLPAFGALLIRHRVEREWTVEVLASAIQLSVAEVKSMERGEYGPTLPEFFRIASVLGEQPAILLTDVIAAWRGDDADYWLYKGRPSDFVRLYRLGYRHKAGDFREQPRAYDSEAEATYVAARLNSQRHARGVVALLDTLCTYIRMDYFRLDWKSESGTSDPKS